MTHRLSPIAPVRRLSLPGLASFGGSAPALRGSALLLLVIALACGGGDDDTSAGTGAAASPASGAGTGGVPSVMAGSSGTGGTSVTPVSGSGANAGSDGAMQDAGASGSSGSNGGSNASDGGFAGTAAPDAGPPVDLPDGVTGLFPLPGAKDVCADAPLHLSFSGPPTLGDSGKVQIFDAAMPGQAVATIDLAVMQTADPIGGQTIQQPRLAFVDGNDVALYPRPRALAYGKSYYVTVDSGAIRGPDNAAFSITDASAWTFTTASAAPASKTMLRVALDGHGDFCSLQSAFDAIPSNNSAKVTVEVGSGTYHGAVYVSGKKNITLHGEDRKAVVIAGVNNNNLNPSTKTRALFGGDGTSGLVIENLTIHNLTPQGGSQAEALRLQNCDQCVIRDADILSLQDTLLWSGRLYAHNCFIAGNVDFIWGTGVAYFDSCEIKTVGRSGPIVQARNAAGAYGYVFVDSHISSDPGLTGSTLARIDANVYPGSHVAYIDCTLGKHISAAAWQLTAGAAGSSLRFWEYNSKDEAGGMIDTSGRMLGSTQITTDQAAQMRDPAMVLGGWSP